jgi:hypothetical protein
MGKVVFRVTHIPNRAASAREAVTFSVVDGEDLVVKSPLPEDVPLNDHLVWLWGGLKLKRRRLKALQADGARLTVEARGFRGKIEIYPNGAEMLHLLGASLEIRIS